jgi:hypothetical protein
MALRLGDFAARFGDDGESVVCRRLVTAPD